MINFELKYRDFEKVPLSAPIDWAMDPFESKNWVHNFLSLRWVPGIGDSIIEELILRDFLRSVATDKDLYSYVMSKKFDHTIAIRVVVLASYLGKIKVGEMSDLLEQQIAREIDDLVYSSTYRFGFNHGLMIDESVLRVRRDCGDGVVSDAHLLEVGSRLSKQLSMLFDESGITREHSISYQEYNLRTLVDIKYHIEALGMQENGLHDVIEFVDKVVENSKLLLAAAYTSFGEYIPFGDSFRAQNKSILKYVYGVSLAEEIFSPFSSKSGLFLFSKAGFGFIRSKDSLDNKWHVGLTCGHNGKCHKQNDEHSIYVALNGHEVISDPGYTDRHDKMGAHLKSRKSHSSLFLADKPEIKSVLSPTFSGVRGYLLGGVKALYSESSYASGERLCRLVVFDPELGVLVADRCNDSVKIVQNYCLPIDDISLREHKVYGSDFSIKPVLYAGIREAEGVDIVGFNRSAVSQRKAINVVGDGVCVTLISALERVGGEFSLIQFDSQIFSYSVNGFGRELNISDFCAASCAFLA